MKKKVSGWDIKLYLDEVFFELINLAYKANFFIKNGKKKYGLQRNLELKDKHIGQRCFVVGNGPSLNVQNLKLLKDEVAFFVNRAFLHPDYEYIQPTYHIIVDPKLQTGEWSITFLDQIAEKNPNVVFLLSAKWYNDPKFQPYKKKFNIYWLDLRLIWTRFFNGKINLSNINVCGAVVEVGIVSAIYMGMKEIYFLGVDGNGLCYNLIGQDSHSYGSNPEDLTKDMLTISKDLYFMSMSARKWVYIANYCEKIGIKLVNLTAGGIMDICPRKKFEEVLTQSSKE
jgi:hypothetical protein